MREIDRNSLPRHIAIIMDGNGRWAKKNSLRRIAGHQKGADAVRTVVRTCRELGIEYLTLYAFSVENWLRPKEEVKALTKLLEEYLRSELSEMRDNGIRLKAIGDIDALSEGVKGVLRDTIVQTACNRKMVLSLALSYGSRDEIVNAAKNLLKECQAGKFDESEITKDLFSRYLYTTDIPDPDLLIRTSGEYRLSNFLMWQMAYTELYFTDVLWPDFSKKDLIDAIADYQLRERRFGLTSEQIKKD